MAKQVVKGGAMFTVYTDKERELDEMEFQREYNKVKDIAVREVEVTICKFYGDYVAKDKRGTIYPLGLVQRKGIIKNPKARQKYMIGLNDYERVIQAKRIVN